MATRARISFPQTVPHVPRASVFNRIDLEGGDGISLPAAGEEIAFLPLAAMLGMRRRARHVERPVYLPELFIAAGIWETDEEYPRPKEIWSNLVDGIMIRRRLF